MVTTSESALGVNVFASEGPLVADTRNKDNECQGFTGTHVDWQRHLYYPLKRKLEKSSLNFNGKEQVSLNRKLFSREAADPWKERKLLRTAEDNGNAFNLWPQINVSKIWRNTS